MSCYNTATTRGFHSLSVPKRHNRRRIAIKKKKENKEKMSVSTEWASTLPKSASAQCKNCARFSLDGETAGEAAAHCKKLSSFSVNSLCVCVCVIVSVFRNT